MKFLSPRFAITLVAIISIWTSSNMNWGGDNYKSIISSDACGYYAYLPAIFIYNDLQFSHFEKVEMSPDYYSNFLTQDYRNKTKGGITDKYYVGCAVLWVPFFGLAHFSAGIFNFPMDGYSYPYQVAINFASIFYLSIGLLLLSRLLANYGFKEELIFWSLIITVFGTNLFYYSVMSPAFSHVYSFSMIVAFLYFLLEYIRKPGLWKILFSAILLGLVVLIRPVNITIILFVPFFFVNFSAFISFTKGVKYSHYLLAILLFTFVISIQLFIYKIQTGNWIVYSYNKETFDFYHPQIVNYLLSYRKGFFLYTPVFFLFLISGIVALCRENKFKAVILSITLLLFWYISSSWWCWWYGDSFSQRPMVDIMFLLSYLICFSLKTSIKYPRILIAAGLLLIVFNQFQIYQYRYFVILHDGMTSELYWNAFLNIQKLIEATK